jgi:acyl-CoA synthetase (AMP-forming)/AMP-acid ligase II
VTTGGLYLSSGIGFLVASLVSQGVHAIEPAEDVERYLRAVEARRPVLARLTVSVAELDVGRFDLSSVELWLQGGHSLREDAFRSLLEQLGPRIVRGYGTTELMGVTALRPNDYLRSDAAAMSVGKPFPGVIVSVGDPSGLADLTHPGRILVRSPSQALGYLNDPKTTAERFRDGWYDTGDVGQVDEEGFVHWLGRDTSDAFDREVWPQQVEVFVNLHRAVKDSAVVVRDGDVVAYVEPRAGSRVDPDEVVSYLRRHLTPNQLPGRIVVVERLPRDERGRVRVDELRRTRLPVATEGVS